MASNTLYMNKSLVQQFLHRFRRSPSVWVGSIILFLLVVTAIFAGGIAPYEPNEGDLMVARKPPVWEAEGSWDYLLGTDQLGQDIFSRIVYGSRVSLMVGSLGVSIAVGIGVSLGVLAGYYGGLIDTLVTSFVNVMLSVPYLALVIVIATVFGRSLINVILIFGVTDAPIFIRLVRGEVLRIKTAEFVLAAQSLGAEDGWIVVRHIVPNLIGPLITLATFEMSAMIFYESGLSFLGLSVPPDVPSWGNMLTLGRRFLQISPWMAIWPGVAIAVTALGINLVGDWLRDILDPQTRR